MSRPTPKVYVVDDDDAVRDSLVALIESHGLAVEVFRSGEEFLNRVSPASQGCLLLDLHLPIVGGLEVLSALRSKGVAIPVILITGGGDGTMATRARQVGAWLVMEKPLNYRELLDNITRALDAH
jgi:FixJ family two-component response regulator